MFWRRMIGIRSRKSRLSSSARRNWLESSSAPQSASPAFPPFASIRPMTKQKMRVGIIGGGLMGREAASAFGRWFALDNFPVQVELTAVCDLQEKLLDWFRQVPTVKLLTKDHAELLRSPDVDVVYVAVPHNLHEKLYLDVLNAGKDLLAEKPFGIDLPAAQTIYDAADKSGRFVRCSSEFPFMPGAQRALQMAQSGQLGKLLEIHSCFWHASDLDP